MIDTFLKVAYEKEVRKHAEFEMVGLLKDIPTLELRQIASGTPISQVYEKRAMLDECPPSAPSIDRPMSFLERFQGTPLYEQALALETEALEAEAANIAHQMAERQEERPWEIMDRIRLKKRLLELELAKQQNGSAQAAPPGEPAQGAGAPGDVPAEGVQDSSQGLQGGVAKSASVQPDPRAVALMKFADGMGRTLARADFEKAARVQFLMDVGSRAGAVMAKTALDPMAIAKGIGGAVSKAAPGVASWAMKNPGSAGAIAGGALGAAGGAVAGGPDHRLSGALGGAALGAGAGGMGTLGRMQAGQSLGGAALNTARAGVNAATRGGNRLAGQLSGGMGDRVSGVVQGAGDAAHRGLNALGGA
jgi:hypothetical protein